VATRPPAATWVRPPLRSLRWIEGFLLTLRQCGFSDQAATDAYQAFNSFLVGHLLLETSQQGADIGPIDEPDPGPARRSDLADYPLLAELAPQLSQDRSAEEFEETLRALIARFAADRANGSVPLGPAIS
jgi:hypothetical protein